MSPSQWHRIPDRAMEPDVLSRIGPTGYVVLGCLARHADREGVCWPSLDVIQEVTGYRSTRTLQMALDRLEGEGLIRRDRRSGKPTLYRVVYTPASGCGGAPGCAPHLDAGVHGDAGVDADSTPARGCTPAPGCTPHEDAPPHLGALTPAPGCGGPPHLDAGEPDSRTRFKEPQQNRPLNGSGKSNHARTREDDAGGSEYVDRVLEAYAELPVPTRRPTVRDRQQAARWREAGIPVDRVTGAMALAASRLLYPNQARNGASDTTIRSLGYFAPVLEEIEAQEIPDDYLRYVREVSLSGDRLGELERLMAEDPS